MKTNTNKINLKVEYLININPAIMILNIILDNINLNIIFLMITIKA